MHLERRLELFESLRGLMDPLDPALNAAIQSAYAANPWFTPENIHQAVRAIREQYLEASLIRQWLSAYEITEAGSELSIGLILAGNVPMVGFQDLLCVLAAGHKAKVKLSDKDRILLPYFIQALNSAYPELSERVQFVERLDHFDAVIATGSDNAGRYFDYYFGKYPHIIRKNRNSMAVLSGSETAEELYTLGQDVFQYFGLGCRNVSMIWLPQDFEIPVLLDAWDGYHTLAHHSKFKNNFDYNCALYILNGAKHYHSDFVVLLEETRLASRIGVVNYAWYRDPQEVARFYKENREQIQCVVSPMPIAGIPVIPSGTSQQPSLMDYADGVDVMEFLIELPSYAQN